MRPTRRRRLARAGTVAAGFAAIGPADTGPALLAARPARAHHGWAG